MKKVILTGFEPFGGYEFNPTEESTKYFSSLGVLFDTQIIGLILPCTYFGAFQTLSEMINQEKPDAIISTGLSSNVRKIRIETTFHNLLSGKYPDADGKMFSDLPILDKLDAPDFLLATADNIYLANVLETNRIPVELSINAEAFVCNSLGYLTTKKILESQSLVRNMFVHIPWTDDYKNKIQLESTKIFLEKEKFYEAIELLIKNI